MSADGKQLAFVSSRSGNQDIWLKDLKAGEEKPLVASPAKECIPRVSPDGNWVSYSADGGVHIVPRKGGMVRRVCNEFGTLHSWSPDNRFLCSGDGTVSLINLATGEISDYLKPSQSSLFLAKFTRDGHWVTLAALERQASPLRLEVLASPFRPDARSEQTDWIRVVSDQYYNDKPAWSDGNRIYFVSDRDGSALVTAG